MLKEIKYFTSKESKYFLFISYSYNQGIIELITKMQPISKTNIPKYIKENTFSQNYFKFVNKYAYS